MLINLYTHHNLMICMGMPVLPGIFPCLGSIQSVLIVKSYFLPCQEKFKTSSQKILAFQISPQICFFIYLTVTHTISRCTRVANQGFLFKPWWKVLNFLICFSTKQYIFSVFSEVANHVSSLLVIINASTNVFIYLYKHEESIPSMMEMVSKNSLLNQNIYKHI